MRIVEHSTGYGGFTIGVSQLGAIRRRGYFYVGLFECFHELNILNRLESNGYLGSLRREYMEYQVY